MSSRTGCSQKGFCRVKQGLRTILLDPGKVTHVQTEKWWRKVHYLPPNVDLKDSCRHFISLPMAY